MPTTKPKRRKRQALPVDPWTAWHLPPDDESDVWVPILVAAGERAATTALNALRLAGDVMVLEAGQDPNAPAAMGQGRRPKFE